MMTSIMDVGSLVSVLSTSGVEKQFLRLPGARKAEVNYVTGSATVIYDEAAIDLKAIMARVHECGYHCVGQQLPKHVCEPEDTPGDAAVMLKLASAEHEHSVVAEHAEASAKDEMAHEMGHGGGMDMQSMVRDMRNRFWVCLIFIIPIFIYSPMMGCSHRRCHPSACIRQFPRLGIAVAFWAQRRADGSDDRKLSDRVIVAVDAKLPIHRRRFAARGFHGRLAMKAHKPDRSIAPRGMVLARRCIDPLGCVRDGSGGKTGRYRARRQI